MFDVWMGDIELTRAVLLFSVVLLLPVQLLLCFKVRSRGIRLLPAALLLILTIIFVAMAAVITGWESLAYVFLAIFAGFMLLICGVGWGIWALASLAQKRKSSGPQP